jgi:hypothetical protein
VRRDLHAACERAKVPPVSPNDLRRTCATWLRAQRAPPHLIAPVLGHVDSRMVERVYGRLPTDHLAARLAQELGANSRPHVGLGFAESLNPVDAIDGGLSTKTLINGSLVVPRDGIERPPRGFSSTSPDGGGGRKDKWLRVLKGGFDVVCDRAPVPVGGCPPSLS